MNSISVIELVYILGIRSDYGYRRVLHINLYGIMYASHRYHAITMYHHPDAESSGT